MWLVAKTKDHKKAQGYGDNIESLTEFLYLIISEWKILER